MLRRGGGGLYLKRCRYVKWGPDEERVFPPAERQVVIVVTVDTDGKFISAQKRPPKYPEIFRWDSRRFEKAFQEAALAATRHAVAQHRERTAAFVDDGAANANDPPF